MNKEEKVRAIKELENILEQNELRYLNSLQAIETTRRQTKEQINKIICFLED